MERQLDSTAACLVRHGDGTLRTLGRDDLDEISELRKAPGTLIWLDLADPGDNEIGLLEREFGLHPLAVEDIRKRRQRPKIDAYDGQYILVAHEVVLPDAAGAGDGAPDAEPDDAADPPGDDDPAPRVSELDEVHLIAGEGYLITIHWGSSEAIATTRRRFQARPTAVGTSVAMLLYAVLDTIVDGYFPLLDRISDRIEEIEDAVLQGSARRTLRDVLRAKRRLLELRRVLTPMRDVANTLLRREVELIEEAAVPYYQDLYDHLVRVLDALDLYRDLVASTLDASLSVTSNNLAGVMKRLTAYTVIIAVPTLIASIYGMNFVLMPELRWPLGYPVVLLVMLVAVLFLVRYFRTRDWF
ncbi:MAG: magnesium/cobalt transporter CorA [Chloroflexota bacterium]